MLKINKTFIKNGDILLKSRLSVYILALIHVVTVSSYLLGLDYSKSKDPNLQEYVKLKWKLITVWFNLLAVPYMVLSVYCDWHELKRRSKSGNIILLNEIRHFAFSSILLPVTMCGDILFWYLYYKDRKLVMPLSADEFVSIWNHHSMHTVSLIFVLFDLACVLRRRPKNMKSQVAALIAFLTLYLFVCGHSLVNGYYVYPGLKLFSIPKLLVIAVCVYVINLFFYSLQWFVVDVIWKPDGKQM